jgi:hypothetical protein
MGRFLAGLGVFGILIWLTFVGCAIYAYFEGVIWGFHHGFVVGVLSLLPPVGLIEGVLHLAGVI